MKKYKVTSNKGTAYVYSRTESIAKAIYWTEIGMHTIESVELVGDFPDTHSYLESFKPFDNDKGNNSYWG